MRRLLLVVMLLAGSVSLLQAATRSDVAILEASEDIKILSQVMAKNYMLLYTYPNKHRLRDVITGNFSKLEESIRRIAVTAKGKKIKSILDYFAYEKEQAKAILAKELDVENVNAILDFSEALTEGAENIATLVEYDASFEEKMFMRSKNISYLVEKLAKYYIVMGTDIDKSTIAMRLKKTISIVDRNIEMIQKYQYSDVDLNAKKIDMLKYWRSNKRYYDSVDTVKVPTLVLLTSRGLMQIMNQFSVYHSRAQ